jgi:hypothetical protein
MRQKKYYQTDGHFVRLIPSQVSRLSADELQNCIIEAQRFAVQHHLSEADWRYVDRLRRLRQRKMAEVRHVA